MKLLIFFLVILIIISSLFGCQKTKPRNLTKATELTDYGALEDRFDNYRVENEWQLYILNKNNTEQIPVILVAKNDKEWKTVPLLAVLKKLGINILWESQNSAILTYNDNRLYLDTLGKRIHYKNDDLNLLSVPAGGEIFFEFVEGEVIVCGPCFNVICQFLGLKTSYSVNDDNKTVEISLR